MKNKIIFGIMVFLVFAFAMNVNAIQGDFNGDGYFDGADDIILKSIFLGIGGICNEQGQQIYCLADILYPLNYGNCDNDTYLDGSDIADCRSAIYNPDKECVYGTSVFDINNDGNISEFECEMFKSYVYNHIELYHPIWNFTNITSCNETNLVENVYYELNNSLLNYTLTEDCIYVAPIIEVPPVVNNGGSSGGSSSSNECDIRDYMDENGNIINKYENGKRCECVLESEDDRYGEKHCWKSSATSTTNSVCTPNVECKEWSECLFNSEPIFECNKKGFLGIGCKEVTKVYSGTQTRICDDKSNCDGFDTTEESQNCDKTDVAETGDKSDIEVILGILFVLLVVLGGIIYLVIKRPKIDKKGNVFSPSNNKKNKGEN